MRHHWLCSQGARGLDLGKSHFTLVLWVVIEMSPRESGSLDAQFELMENR